MKITKEELLHTAKLANLKIDKEQENFFKADIEDFLTFSEQLDELDLDGVAPTKSTASFTNILREDVINSSLDKDDVLKNASKKDKNGIVVPKILE